MWWEWIQRANRGGQRVLVALTVNNRLLGDSTAGQNDLPTDDKTSADLQIAALKAFVSRHTDFMGIALTPADVLDDLADGKTAVIIGTEIDTLGNYYANQGTEAELIAEVDRLYSEGVRYIFPIHLVDNAIGGSAAYNPLFDLANWYEDGYWNNLVCSQMSDGIGYTSSDPLDFSLVALMAAKLQRVPLYGPPALQCPSPGYTGYGNVNSRGLTIAGQAAIQEMMNLGMLIDIDHMSEAAANATIALASVRSYPLFSGHNGTRTFQVKNPVCLPPSGCPASQSSERSLSELQYARLGKNHGMAGVGSAQLTADNWAALYQDVITAMGPGSGAGFGTDMDGMEFGMPPRPGSNVTAKYQSFGYLPMSTGGSQSWNYDYAGVAHYGMLPDFLYDVASLPASNSFYQDGYVVPFNGGSQVVATINASAQYFYETWRLATGEVSQPGPPPPASAAAGSFTATAANFCPGTQQRNTLAASEQSQTQSANPAPPCVCANGASLSTSGATAGACTTTVTITCDVCIKVP